MNANERRASRRFPLQQHAVLILENGDHHEISAVTENACIQGVLVVADSKVSIGCHVEVTILLQGDGMVHALRLHGSGRVVRVEERSPNQFAIAVRYDHPLAEA